MKRVVSTLDKTEKDLSALEEERKRYSDGAAERLLAALQKACERLEGLPAAEEGASEARARVEDLEARVRALIAEKGSLGAKSGLDSKAAGRLNSLDTKLANLANELAKQGERGTFNDRQRERVGSKVSGLKKDLEAYPAENHVVAGLLGRLGEIAASLAELSSDLSSAQACAAEEEAERERLEADPAFEGDLERVKHFCELFKTGRRYFALDALHLRRIDGAEEEACDQARRRSENLADYAELRARYDIIVSSGQSRSAMRWALREGDEWLPRYTETLERFVEEAPGALRTAVEEALELAQMAVAERKHRPFSYESSDLRSRARYARNLALLYDLCGTGVELTPEVDALGAKLAEEEEQLAEEIVAANRVPQDAYTGSDRGELEGFVRAQWAEHFPEEELLELCFPQEAFARTTAWRMESSQPQLTKVDHSDLWIRVVVAAGSEAILYRVLISRLHLQADRLTLRWSRPDPVPPGSRMLRANLVGAGSGSAV